MISAYCVTLLSGLCLAASPLAKEETPALPVVVLIGDSIRMGYAPVVAEKLKGVAEVVSAAENGGDSRNVLKNLDAWAIAPKPAVIHFNAGLHDLKADKKTGTHQVELDAYRANLEKIVKRLEAETSARLIFATTTPVIDERHRAARPFSRTEADVEAYNRAALAIMKKSPQVEVERPARPGDAARPREGDDGRRRPLPERRVGGPRRAGRLGDQEGAQAELRDPRGGLPVGGGRADDRRQARRSGLGGRRGDRPVLRLLEGGGGGPEDRRPAGLGRGGPLLRRDHDRRRAARPRRQAERLPLGRGRLRALLQAPRRRPRVLRVPGQPQVGDLRDGDPEAGVRLPQAARPAAVGVQGRRRGRRDARPAGGCRIGAGPSRGGFPGRPSP